MKTRIFQGLMVFAIVPVLVTAIWGGVLPADWRREPISQPMLDTLKAERDYVNSLFEGTKSVALFQDGEGNSIKLEGSDTQFSNANPGDWRAVDTEGQLTDDLRPGYVMLNPAGSAEGTLLNLAGEGAAGMTVYLMQSGRTVGTDRTDVNGAFEIPSIDPGVYSMIAVGEGGLGVFALAYVPYQDIEDFEVGMETFVVPAPLEYVLSTLEGGFPSMRDSAVDEPKYLEMSKPANDGDPVPSQFHGLREILRRLQTGQQQTNLQGHAALINAEKVLWGRIIGIERVTGRPMIIDEMTVHLLKNDGTVHGKFPVDDRGVFKFENVEPGNYGLLGSGADGFFVVGLHTENAPEAAAGVFINEFFVGAQGSSNTTSVAPVTNPDDLQNAFESEGGQPAPSGGQTPAPSAQTGSSSGGGGGGGGGAGAAFGAVGAILGAAGLAQGDDATATPADAVGGGGT
jgi:hypothetical protein